MKKQIVIVGIIVLLVCVGLSGCSNNPFDTEKNKFVGTWKTNSTESFNPANLGTVIFFSDGTLSLSGLGGMKYEIKDGKLVISTNNNELQYTFEYSFSNSNTVLTLSLVGTDNPVVYTKQ